MKIIGHRGAKGLAPENTIAGFKKAIELNVDAIEIDVLVTKDHHPVIHHDSTIKLKNGNRLKIAETAFRELKKHKADMPDLGQTLKFVKGRVPLYLEVKMGVDVGPIILELNHYNGKFYLASKSQKTLLKLHQAFPDAPKIVIEPFSAIRAIWRAAHLNTRILAMNQLFLWPGVIRKLKSRGYEVWAYPLNDPRKAERWEQSGLAGVITDYPDRFTQE
jgi:glycerophosphoryl diester phosphodiesterase